MQSVAVGLERVRERTGEDEFEVLLEPLLQPAYRLACGMLHDPQAAQDAVQEASLKAWRKLGRLREGAEMRPWFFGIVANECRSWRRSRWAAVVKSFAPDHLGGGPDADVSGLDVRRALRRLDHGTRLVIVLRWYLDLPVREIAVATGLSEHAVESRLRRGVASLRNRLSDEDSNG